MIRLRMLMDNKSLPGLAQEWGLAVAVETEGGLILWDCGASGAFLSNAEAMGVDVTAAQALAISHGHWDHGGGYTALHKAGFNGPVLLHPAGLEPKYHVDPKENRSLNIPCALHNVDHVRHSRDMAPGVTMITDIERIAGSFQAVAHFYQDREGIEQDLVPDDAFLLLTHGDRHSVLLGCCHSGLSNSLEHLKKTKGIERIDTLVGGLHLYDAPPDAMEETAEAIERFGVRRVFAGHCTGDRGMVFLKDRLSCMVEQTLSGTVIELD